MAFIDTLKKIPLDFGQANLRTTTKGKLIALSLVKDGKGKKALDVGCREGHQSEWLKRRGYKVTSIDIEPHYKHGKKVDANKPLPFKDDTFDLIWCSEVIEHLKVPEKTKQEFERVLKRGGEAIITTPNSHFWIYPLLRLIGLKQKDVQNKSHIHFFSLKDVRGLFPHARISGFFPYLFLKFRIHCCVGFLSPTFVIYAKKSFSKP